MSEKAIHKLSAICLSVLLTACGGGDDAPFLQISDPAKNSGPIYDIESMCCKDSIVTGDFNNDGNIDVAAAATKSSLEKSSGLTAILINEGNQRFRISTRLSETEHNDTLASGDLNLDGIDDLVVFGEDRDADKGILQILIAKGDGNFSKSIIMEDASNNIGDRPKTIMIRDLNRDNLPDILRIGKFEKSILAYIGNGEGSFESPIISEGNFGNLDAFVFGDFNEDGYEDIITAAYDAEVFLGNGTGHYLPFDTNGDSKSSRHDLLDGVSKGDTSMASHDFDNDGHLDLVISSSSNSNVRFLKGKGNGLFESKQSFNVGEVPQDLVIADFNVDGKMDVATANRRTNDISILLGHGDGMFADAIAIDAEQSPHSLAVADFDNNGFPDVVVLSNDIVFIMNPSK